MKKSTRRLLRDYGTTVLAAVGVAVLIRAYLVEPYRIPSAAMKPALEAGDTIFVSKWAYRSGHAMPRRGEIVVFSGLGSEGAPRVDFIKRVIGLPGDSVSVKNGRINLNGEEITTESKERLPCAKERLPLQSGDTFSYDVCREPPIVEDFGPEKVPPGSVFVIGDERTRGPIDSRIMKSWGVIPVAVIRGKATIIWFSVVPSSGLFPQIRFERIFRRIL